MSLLAVLRGTRAGDATGAAVVDLSFDLQGDVLPADYPQDLEAALVAALPWAADEPLLGIHRVRAPLTEAGYVLSRRSRLTVRVPVARQEEAARLAGCALNVGPCRLGVGRVAAKPVTAFPTLRAPLVVNAFADEQAFLDDVGMQLEVLAVRGDAMCGKAAAVASPGGTLRGFALVLHGLSAEDSLRVQAVGLGPGRRLGCGLFVHHKIIDGLDAWPE